MKRNRMELLLQEPNLYKVFFILAAPIFGANFLKAFNDLVDTYFVGQIPNSVSAQAGISVAWPLINIVLSFQIGLAVAGVAVISQLLGGGHREEARKYAGVLMTLGLFFGVLLNVLLYVLSEPVMYWMGAKGETLSCAVIYLRTRSFEMLFVMIFSVFQAIRQAQGDTTTPVLLSIGTIVINVVLTGLFVAVFNMGVFGAALATAIGQAAVCPVAIWLTFSPKEFLSLKTSDLKVKWENVKRLFKIAIPSAASQALSSLGFLILQALILDYGDVVTAAFSNGNKISSMLLMPVLALGSVLAAYVGQNIGAGNREKALKAYKISRNISFGLALVGSAILLPFRWFLAELLSNNPATQTAAVEYIFWVLLTQPLMALFQNYISVFNGAGNTGFSFIMSSVRLWCIRLPLILLFKSFTDLGSLGIWYAMVISNFLILLLGTFFFRKVDFSPKIPISSAENKKGKSQQAQG